MYELYSRVATKETVLEIWGGSTKHPDSVFYFSNFKKVNFINPYFQIPQWIFECASKMTFPFHAKPLAEFGLEAYNLINTRSKKFYNK
jgi:hypothetical protein